MDNGVAPLLARAFLAEPADPAEAADPTAERILDAAVTEAAAQGLRELTMDGVARHAKVNRVTVYRRFSGDRERLLAALVVREGQRAIAAMTEAMASISDPDDRFVESFLAVLRFTRTHPIVSRMAQWNPRA